MFSRIFRKNTFSTEHLWVTASVGKGKIFEIVRKDLEAATVGFLWKKVFIEISQILQENTCDLVHTEAMSSIAHLRRLW